MPNISSTGMAADNVSLEIAGGLMRAKALGIAAGHIKIAGNTYTILGGFLSVVMAGGQYIFYPQTKMSAVTASNDWRTATVLTEVAAARWTDYCSNIDLESPGGLQLWVRSNYIAASGRDHWLFILWDTKKNRLLGGWEAPDHPCYGNGNDEKIISHPFNNFRKSIPAHLELILVDLAGTYQIAEQTSDDKDLLTLVSESYKPDFSKTHKFEGRDFAWLDKTDWTSKHRKILTIPDYIKVRGMVKK